MAFIWKQPPNHPFINMGFQMPSDHGGRLEYVEVAFYESGSSGTPDPDVYVWMSDGTFPLDSSPPSQAIAEFHLDYTDIVWFPDFTAVQTYPLGIVFDPGELFHVGVSHAFEPGDTLALMSDAGSLQSDRASGWDGSAWESYEPYEIGIHATICPFGSQSTFIMECSPVLGFATPGDPSADVYQVQLGSILGYTLPLTLNLLSVEPPANINATFAPNGAPCPCTSNVAIAVDGGVPYGDYDLTFQAVGGDGQTKTCDVTLRVQPPYEEAEVNFYHGMQRVSNFGAIGNGGSPESFVWYGTDYLYDGSFLLAGTDTSQMALDMYDFEHSGWVPTEHLDLYYDAEYNANVAYANLVTETVPGECESVFVIGVMDECVGFSIKIKVSYNTGDTSIPELYAGVFEDWDVTDFDGNWVEMDTLRNLMYMYHETDPVTVFGIMTAPFYDLLMHSMIAYHIGRELYWIDVRDTLFVLMTTPDPHYRFADWFDPDPTDFALLTVSPPFSLDPGEGHIEIWIDFGRDLNDGMTWEQWYHKVLRYVGFYRGDVNPPYPGEQPTLDVSDVIHLVNYLFKAGPVPFPYSDQGDVNADGTVELGDLVYLINYLYRSGPAPVDYVRFIPSFWSRPSLFTNPNW
jgi:hypothetical protein